jgi:TfoX/Sxy family transcriptional regulator of competence genes
MAYNQELADRIRSHALTNERVSEIKMFGGIAFMVGTNMFCGITNDDLMARIDPDTYEAALAKPGARPMDFTGRPTRGMVFVGPDGYKDDAALAGWVQQSCEFASTVPEKKPRKSTAGRRKKP